MHSTKSRGILYSSAMIAAKMQGRKTQTRRVVKPQPYHDTVAHGESMWIFEPRKGIILGEAPHWLEHCPYGKVGDILYARETWQWEGETPWTDAVPVGSFWYKADEGKEWKEGTGPAKWKSPLFMPRVAARIIDEIVDIRVERLQDMDGQAYFESDAIQEGINSIHHGDGAYYYSAFRDYPDPQNWIDPFDAFKELWILINGQDSWDSNPWVWVITTKNLSTTGWQNIPVYA